MFQKRFHAIMILLFSLAALAAGVGIGYRLGKRKASSPRSLVAPAGLKVLLIGVDGAEWSVINLLMEQGRLPNFARLVKEGASGKLKTLEPILSPIIWTSIATGKTPDKHGITYFSVRDPEHARRFPAQSTMRKCKAVWNILSEQGLSVGVIGWWATFPAEKVNGFVVSDYMAYHAFGLSGKEVKTSAGKTYPPQLFEKAAAAIQDPLTLSKEEIDPFIPLTDKEYEFSINSPFDFGNPLHHFMFALATAKAYRKQGLELYKEYRPDWMGIYFEQVDTVSHIFMKYAPPKMEGMAPEFYEKYKNTVFAYYEFQDMIIGDFLEAADKNTVVVVCSDHGFKTGDKRLRETEGTSLAKAHLWHELYGVLILWGPPVKKGVKLEGASVLDITPTVLYLLGLPAAKDMDGKVLLDAFTEEFKQKHPLRWVDSYETPQVAQVSASASPSDSAVDREVLARLKALGYIGDELDDTEMRKNRVGQYLKSGNFAGAREELSAILKKHPGDPWAKFTLAQTYESQGDTEKALELYRELAQDPEAVKKPGSKLFAAEALKKLSVAAFDQGRLEEAIADLEKAGELNPRDPDLFYNLGVMLEKKGEPEQAEKQYRRAVELNPSHAQAHNNLGNLYRARGEQAKAEEEYKKAADADPNHVESRFNLAMLYLQSGRQEQAEAQLEKALELNPDLKPARTALAGIYERSKEYGKAISVLEPLLKETPDNPFLLFTLGRLYARAGNLAKAKELLEKAMQLDPEGVKRALAADPELREKAGISLPR